MKLLEEKCKFSLIELFRQYREIWRNNHMKINSTNYCAYVCICTVKRNYESTRIHITDNFITAIKNTLKL